MRKILQIIFLAVSAGITAIPSFAAVVLEPCTYTENFEGRLLGAWASYPLWQDTAYDPNFRINEIVPGDPNVSIEQKVTPYTNVDNYAGAQKILDMYLVPGSTVSLRYYLKSSLPFEYFKVRLASGPDGKVDFTFPNPTLNAWTKITVTWDDFIRENPLLSAKDRIRVNALAVLAKLPKADPFMPFYLGLDDITFKGAREIPFQFLEPQVIKLPEWKPYIPKKFYLKGDTLTLRGNWPLTAGKVELTIVPYDDRTKKLIASELKKETPKKGQKESGIWSFSQALTIPEGLYLGTLRALEPKTNNLLAETEFTIHIAPKNMAGKHPRLWFDSAKKEQLIARLKTDRFQKVYAGLTSSAESYRKSLPVEKIVYDLDQYPDENWLATWSESGAKIFTSGEAVNSNALAYALCGDKAAGEYTKNVLLKLATFPTFNHPWQAKRGRYADHRSGAWSHRLALGYDLTYDLMTEEERKTIRKAFMDYIVKDAFKSHVYDNNITSDTSNWIAMIAGGSLMIQAAMFGDGPDVAFTEPYFTGTAMKLQDFLTKVNDPTGAWGEGLGYNYYSFDNLARSLPSLDNVFSIDFSKPAAHCFLEYIWAGIVKDKKQFYYGDSNGNLSPATNFAFLLAKTKDPLLGWFYNYLKEGDTFMDALYETLDVPKKDPFGDNPVKLFRNVGTTVFKSGWEKDDFVFVMRTGAFYNHQHLDQGSFWLADRGTVFLEERHGSTYYDDPLYQPWYTQPVGHSTILIDGNHQSQRVGDPLVFADGFDDYARVTHFLDGEFASFSTGEIGDIYWGKVKSLERNMLYLKPRTVLMLDTVVPAERNVDVNLLYQTLHLNDITAGDKYSTISKDGNSLFFMHLAPEKVSAVAEETPHYLYTLQREKPLEKEGMLKVTAKTIGVPLVMANLLTTTKGEKPDVESEVKNGCVVGKTGGVNFAFSTRPGFVYKAGGFDTDAVAISWNDKKVFAARFTSLFDDGKLLMKAAVPVTVELSKEDMFKYYHCTAGEISIYVGIKPAEINVNGAVVKNFSFEAEKGPANTSGDFKINLVRGGLVTIKLPAGEGTVALKF
jgi:hypothetical protein